jgi:hypothetical protein
MKIKVSDVKAIDTALDKVNGRSTTHTAGWNVVALGVRAAEKTLEKLGIPKAKRKGATYYFESGSKLPNSYKGAVNITRCTITRGASEWYLTSATLSARNPTSAPKFKLCLTPEQDELAIAKVRSQYVVPYDIYPDYE